MNTEIDHTTADKFITITNDSISIDLTNIEDSRTADTFTQELSTYIKTRSGLTKSSNDTNSNAIGSGAVGSFGAVVIGVAGVVSAGNLLGRLGTLFRTNKVPASDIQADIARNMLILGKELRLDSMSIKITKGASIGIGGDITGFNAELTKNDDNTIELSVKY
jgi:hypothetical protein